MFQVKNPCDVNREWWLSKKSDIERDIIPMNVTKLLKNYHILGIEFLYRCLRSKFNGAILNIEDDMNGPLQITSFLSATFKFGLCVVVCHINNINQWYYHLMNHSDGHVIFLTERNFHKVSIDTTKPKIVLLLTHETIKLAYSLLEDYEYFAVIVDQLDQIATKLILRKLKGYFNIGLTYRNFYLQSDQKIQWSMLNWANSFKFGQLKDFYRIDDDNNFYFRNNYRHWWCRLTWAFCESFQRPSTEEIEIYKESLVEWAKKLHIITSVPNIHIKRRKRLKKVKKRRRKEDNVIFIETKSSHSKKDPPAENTSKDSASTVTETKIFDTTKLSKSCEYVGESDPVRSKDNNCEIPEIHNNDENILESSTQVIQTMNENVTSILLVPQSSQDVIEHTMRKSCSSKCEEFLRSLASSSRLDSQETAKISQESLQKLLQDTDAILKDNF